MTRGICAMRSPQLRGWQALVCLTLWSNSKTWALQCSAGRSQASLYAECESYGLVGREKKTYWRWRHQFLVDCLAGSLEGEVHG